MKSTYIAAFVVAALFIVWLLSGQLGSSDDREPAPSLATTRDAMMVESQDAPARVRARTVSARLQTADLIVRGRTEADRMVTVRTETNGRIEGLPVEKGERVAEGDLLCRIAVDTRDARIEEARQVQAQARIEYDGAISLRERGFQSETAIAAARARLATSTADLAQRELDLERTFVRAPFAGIVETRPVEIGDYLQAGSVCATVVDPDPMMLVGQVSEQEVGRITLGSDGFGTLITGQQVAGTVAYVATTAMASTRTFRIEVAVANPDARLRDGITTEISIPVEEFSAHRIPSSILALDDAGDLGVRIVDADDRVRFVNVVIVKDEAEGIWVRGLPETARIITVGQELVTSGQQVEVIQDAGNALSRDDTDQREAPPALADDATDTGADDTLPAADNEASLAPAPSRSRPADAVVAAAL